jgi:hypothetical protein
MADDPSMMRSRSSSLLFCLESFMMLQQSNQMPAFARQYTVQQWVDITIIRHLHTTSFGFKHAHPTLMFLTQLPTVSVSCPSRAAEHKHLRNASQVGLLTQDTVQHSPRQSVDPSGGGNSVAVVSSSSLGSVVGDVLIRNNLILLSVQVLEVPRDVLTAAKRGTGTLQFLDGVFEVPNDVFDCRP